MNPQVRRVVNRLPRHRRERDILDAATAIFSDQGYEFASMAEIAARAGIVEGTIYKYFDNKRDLLLHVMARWYEAMLANYSEHLSGVKGTRERLRYVIWRHLAFIAANPALCRVFFREIRTGDDYHGSPLNELNRRYTRFIIDVLQEGIDAGEFRPDLPLPLVRDIVYGTIEHHVWCFLSGKGEIAPDAIANSLCDLVFHGIANAVPVATPPALDDRLLAAVSRIEAAAHALEQQAAGREARP